MTYRANGLYLFVGISESGKTHVMRYIASKMAREFDYAVGFCPTKFRGSINYIPDDRVYEGFRSDVFEKLLNKQKQLIEASKATGAREPKVLVVCDDVLGDKEMKLYGHLWQSIASSCRHYNITVFIATQYTFAVPPIMRRNARVIVLTSVPTETDAKTLFSEFCRYIDRKDFLQMIEQATQGHSCLQINTQAKDQKTMYQRLLAPAKIGSFVIGN